MYMHLYVILFTRENRIKVHYINMYMCKREKAIERGGRGIG